MKITSEQELARLEAFGERLEFDWHVATVLKQYSLAVELSERLAECRRYISQLRASRV